MSRNWGIDDIIPAALFDEAETVTAAHIGAALIPPVVNWGAIYDVDDFCELDYQRSVWYLDGEAVTI